MEDTDWRPSPCPLCGEIREAAKNPICHNTVCQTKTFAVHSNERERSMKLGEKLKQTLDELERAKINGIEAQHRADMEKIRKARADTKDWLDFIRETFVNQIEAGKVPLKKIENFDRESWLKKAVQGKAENQDLWNDFRQYWRSEGLEPEINEAHDGMGMKSWINFTVKVLPERPRSVSTTGASGYRTPFENRD